MKPVREKISLEIFDYHLPEKKIAQIPVTPRDSSKLLVYSNQQITDSTFNQLHTHLPKHSLLVFNNTRVIPARLFFQKDTGGLIQVFLLNPKSNEPIEQVLDSKQGESVWKCMVGNLKKWKDGNILSLVSDTDIGLKATLVSRAGKEVKLHWPKGESLASILEKAGKIPLPPYIQRDAGISDSERYQTVYAKNNGAVAAPTAGLHFSENVFKNLESKGIQQCPVTLHVGAGTFKPVSVANILDHEMHEEIIVVEKSSLIQLVEKRRRIAVGTTSLRTLESLYWAGVKILKNMDHPFHIEQHLPYQIMSTLDFTDAISELLNFLEKNGLSQIQMSTGIMITPNYTLRSIDGLITNFHLPKSTLLMLISSLLGNKWKEIYNHALGNEYRFLSYGDSSLLLP